MSKYHTDCFETMKTLVNLFPIEVDLTANMLDHSSNASGGGSAASHYEYEDERDETDTEEEDATASHSDSHDDKLIDISAND
jgi:hypothetical protein